MSAKSSFELHALNMGKLVGNLLSIETAARMFLAQHEEKAAAKSMTQLPAVKEGDFVDKDPLTNGDDLRKTLQKYNKRSPNGYGVAVDEIVALRDSLAHGRMFGFGNVGHLRLLKFSRKTTEGKVRVESAQDMSEEWFDYHIKSLNGALHQLTLALGYEKREFD